MIEFIKLIKNIISHDLFGKHKWVYYRSSNFMSIINDKYNLRKCSQCNETQIQEIIYEKWRTITSEEFEFSRPVNKIVRKTNEN